MIINPYRFAAATAVPGDNLVYLDSGEEVAESNAEVTFATGTASANEWLIFFVTRLGTTINGSIELDDVAPDAQLGLTATSAYQDLTVWATEHTGGSRVISNSGATTSGGIHVACYILTQNVASAANIVFDTAIYGQGSAMPQVTSVPAGSSLAGYVSVKNNTASLTFTPLDFSYDWNTSDYVYGYADNDVDAGSYSIGGSRPSPSCAALVAFDEVT